VEFVSAFFHRKRLENISNKKHASERSELKTIFVLSRMDNFKLSQIKVRVFIFFYFFGALPIFAQNDSTAVKSLYENTDNSGFPVIGFSGDTLFYVYDRIGASTPKERASQISDKIKLVFEAEQFHVDSIRIIDLQNSVDLVFGEVIITTITNEDKATYGLEKNELAAQLKVRVGASYHSAESDQKFITNLIRGILVLLVIGSAYFIYWLLGILNKKALIDAALRTEKVLKSPEPFVLQTGLEDFYVSYQINAYTKESNSLPKVYSELHQHIQDCCFDRGIEILSPRYRAARDGNMTTIPSAYLSKDYQVPSFNLRMEKGEDK
jgi:hypothetical protein